MFTTGDPRLLPLSALSAVTGTWGAQVTEAVNGSTLETYLAQLGVTGACLVIGWLMLRRSDQRDKLTKSEESAHEKRADLALREQLESERAHCREAKERADRIEQRHHDLEKLLHDVVRKHVLAAE